MSRFAHTPGPWFAIGAQVKRLDKHVQHICTCGPIDIKQEHRDRPAKEVCANARLIAAAPSLLAACAAWIDYMDGPLCENHTLEYEAKLLQALRNAIAGAVVESAWEAK